jgi:hypothetical protein
MEPDFNPTDPSAGVDTGPANVNYGALAQYDSGGADGTGTVTSNSPAGLAASQNAGAGNANGSGGLLPLSWINSLSAGATGAGGILNALRGQPARTPVQSNSTMYIVIAGVVVLVLAVVFLGRRS